MKHTNLFITVLILSLSSAGFTQTTQTLNFQVAGKARNCVVRVPSGISNPAVVFFLHGAGGSGSGFQNDTKADVVADREKFIAAYPSGINGNWDYSDASADFTFMLALIDTLAARYHIDRNRVYASGFSMGGGMTFALGCKYANVFAAIAPVSAAGTACTPSRKIPVFLTFGTKDLYPPSQFMTSVNRWVGLNGCPTTPTVTRPYPAARTRSVVTRLTYGPCAQGSEIVVDSIQNGPHEWPMDTNTKVNNSEEVWAFFKKISLAATAVVPSQKSPGAYDGITATCSSNGTVRLLGATERVRVTVLDTKGRSVLITDAVQPQFSLKNKPRGVYIILISDREKKTALRMAIP